MIIVKFTVFNKGGYFVPVVLEFGQIVGISRSKIFLIKLLFNFD